MQLIEAGALVTPLRAGNALVLEVAVMVQPARAAAAQSAWNWL